MLKKHRFIAASFVQQLRKLLVIGAATTYCGFAAQAAELVESDLCIYGGTSGGVVAAVQAARMGKSVVVVEPGRHLGGMTSGGLGQTDVGNSATIGGLSREFYRRVGQRYGRAESFTFEPHVAEEVFAGWLQELQVPVYYERRLVSVSMTGLRITEITTEDGSRFKARMFLDTTYEGDLLAMAGVTFTVGRESTNTYGESLNGIRPNTPSHQFVVAVDPYVIPGDPNSGLLPLIQADGGGVPGQGDHRVQAYNFRLCLTQVETNKLPITPPPDYDPARFELLGRYIQARLAAGHNLTLGSFLNISTMPNGKTDINNNGAISTDFIGMNYTYPTNTYAERERIKREHEYYIRGLLTFLATDSRVPETVRNSMQSWGLCRDEFKDTGGWPHQLYAREARRMVSDYVVTQADCDGLRVAPDSVGLASYNMDSHNCQRFATNGSAINEGDVQRAPAGPFPISYRAIVPRRGECENLFATFCLSGSHIGFSSCRMEPVFMITSQSAATAAALAIDDNTPVQDVPYAKLRLHLLAGEQILQWGSAVVPTNGIVLDSEQTTNAVTVIGSWATSASVTGYNGSNYFHDNNTGKGTKSVRYTPYFPAPGRYTVYLRWTQNPNRASNVPLTLFYDGGQTNFTVNQRTNGGIWYALGIFPFSAGSSGSLLLETTGTDGYVVADATLWMPEAVATLPTVEVVASDSVASEDGPDPAVFAVVRSGDTSAAITIAYELSGSAVAGVDYPAATGLLTMQPGQTVAKLTLLPLADSEAEGDETIVFTLTPSASYQLGVYTQATAVVHDGGLGRWRALHFNASELADPAQSGLNADPDGDGLSNLLEFFHDTDPKTPNAAPALQILRSTNGLSLGWQRASSAAGLFMRVEHSTDLSNWHPAPYWAQLPLVNSLQGGQQELRFDLGALRPDSPQGFYRVAASTAFLPWMTNDAKFFFSFDSTPDGTNAFQITVTTNAGFVGQPVITRTGTALGADGGAASFTDFTGTTWLGSGGAATPGHSLAFNNGSANNSFSLTFSTLGLRSVRLRMDIRSAAQAGGSAPTAFSSFTYDIGGGPQPVPGVDLAVIADNAFHQWTVDLSGLTILDNRPSVTLTWTIRALAANPAESFRVDNIQVTASPAN